MAGAGVGPRGETGVDQPAGQAVEFGARLGLAPLDFGPRLGERPAADIGIEVVAGLDQRRRCRAGIEVDQPVLDRAVLADQDHQPAGRLDADELDVLEPDVDLAGEHDARPARQAGQRLARVGQQQFDAPPGVDRLDLRLDLVPLLDRQVAHFEQCVDEEAQPEVGRQPSCRGMRRVDQPEALQIGHHVPDRGRRERDRELAADVARAHRLAGAEVQFDDLAEDLAGTAVEILQGRTR